MEARGFGPWAALLKQGEEFVGRISLNVVGRLV